jgi:hypothetical protein
MKYTLFILLVISFVFVGNVLGQKTKKVIQGNVCGNPTVKCKADDGTVFEPNDVPFEIPKGYIVYQSKPFYAIILKSNSVTDLFGGEETCQNVVTEDERKNAQRLFPSNKVFTYNCGYGMLYYSGIKENTVFMAVYGGNTLQEAKNFMKYVEKSGKFAGAYIKKLQAEFNGT